MKKIAIFVSGAGDSAERIVKLFNEGNRVRTELVIVDDSAVSLSDRLQNEDVKVVHIPDSEWHQRATEVAELLKNNDIRLLVLDNFALSLSDEILEATNGEMLRVTSPEQAPREIVAALEADLRRPQEEVKVPEVEENPTPESEWAEALKIRYTPPEIPTTPPEVPGMKPDMPYEPYQQPQEKYPHADYQGSDTRRHHHEPMPSTWLIWSILVTVFCCFIPGIIAIIFSSQVSSRYFAGDIDGARRASRMAEIWIIVSFVLGVLSATLYLPFLLIGG